MMLFIKKEHFFLKKLVSLLSMAVRMCYLGNRYPSSLPRSASVQETGCNANQAVKE